MTRARFWFRIAAGFGAVSGWLETVVHVVGDVVALVSLVRGAATAVAIQVCPCATGCLNCTGVEAPKENADATLN